MKKVFLAWQDSESRLWFPIGCLSFESDRYWFNYVRGAHTAQQEANFQPLWAFPDLEATYESTELFPLFANRLLRRSRPDYPDFVEWLNVPKHQDDPITLLARSGGKRATDTLELYPCPELDAEGFYHIHFFARGLRYLPPKVQSKINDLETGQKVQLIPEPSNQFDSKAILLRTETIPKLGYCPRYLVDDIHTLLQDSTNQIQVVVDRVNPPPTPIQFRVLCNLSARWPEGFQPFTSPMYEPLAEAKLEAIA